MFCCGFLIIADVEIVASFYEALEVMVCPVPIIADVEIVASFCEASKTRVWSVVNV
ncbi:MAG: hypothetical protein WBA93_05125 [Microcoleaceae cyanobacterium]